MSSRVLKPAVSLCSQPTGAVPLSVTAALQLTHSQEDSSRCSDNSSYEEPLSPISASSSTSRRRQGQRDLELPDMHMRDLVGMGHHFLPSEPTKWNVEDVYEFIRSLPGKARGSPVSDWNGDPWGQGGPPLPPPGNDSVSDSGAGTAVQR